MLKYVFAALMMVGILGTSVSVNEAAETKNAMCPVAKGKAVNPKQAVAYEGAQVFFCCGGCKSKFSEDPAKFAIKANHQLVVTKQASQKACPLTGRDVDGSKTVTVGKVEVSLCCGGCVKKAQGMNEAAQAEALFGKEAFKKGFAVKK